MNMAAAGRRKDCGCCSSRGERQLFNPNIDLPVGVVNVWNWDCDAVALPVKCNLPEESATSGAGAEILGLSLPRTRARVLTSRYKIYEDMMNPDSFPLFGGGGPGWMTSA
jgi:hypothetical protein